MREWDIRYFDVWCVSCVVFFFGRLKTGFSFEFLPCFPLTINGRFLPFLPITILLYTTHPHLSPTLAIVADSREISFLSFSKQSCYFTIHPVSQSRHFVIITVSMCEPCVLYRGEIALNVCYRRVIFVLQRMMDDG